MASEAFPSRGANPMSRAEHLSNADIAEVLERLGAAVLATDSRGRVVLANERAHDVLQRPERELIGRPVDEVLTPFATLVELATGATDGEERRSQCSVSLHGGARIDVGYTVTCLDGLARTSSAPRYVVVFQDITPWEKLREERDRLLRLAAVSEVLPSLLHELKNPLAAIASAVELVIEEMPDGEARGDLHAVLGEIRRMKLTLEGIGLVGRELSSARHHPIDLAITDVFHVLHRQASARGIRMSSAVPTLPLLPLDPSVVRAIVFNLLQNALHACEDTGSIELSANLEHEHHCLSIRVVDTGAGMSTEVQRQCTDLFFTTKPKGTGIGLALVKRAVESIGGSICIRSAVGAGTAIEVAMPVDRRTIAAADRTRIH